MADGILPSFFSIRRLALQDLHIPEEEQEEDDDADL
jgi:hypothetical protein